MGPSCVCVNVWVFEPIHFTNGRFYFKVHNYYKEVAKDDVKDDAKNGVNDFCCFSKLNCLNKNKNIKSEVLS